MRAICIRLVLKRLFSPVLASGSRPDYVPDIVLRHRMPAGKFPPLAGLLSRNARVTQASSDAVLLRSGVNAGCKMGSPLWVSVLACSKVRGW